MINTLETYQIRLYKPEDKADWDSFVAQAKNATFLFQRDFMDYHAHRFTDYSLMVYHRDKPVALLPANIQDNVLYSHQGLSYGGLVLDKDSNLEGIKLFLKSTLSFLESENIEKVQIKLVPRIYNRLPSDEMDYLLFLLQAKLIRRDLSSCIINSNRLPIASSNRLRGIKKGKKNNLEVRESSEFGPFWKQVLEPNLKQMHNQKPVHSVDEIIQLKSNFPNNIRQFNVYLGNEIVAGTTVFETEEVAHTQYISANAIGKKVGGLDFLFSQLLQIFSHKTYFDFGICNEMQGMKVNKGLLQWKESFGGRGIAHDFYEIETKNHHFLNDIFI